MSNIKRFQWICGRIFHGNQKMIFGKPKTAASFIIFLVLLSSCNTGTLESLAQPTSGLTPLSNQPSFLRISEQNAASIGSIKEWKVYDINAVAWGINSAGFAVAGKENRNDAIFGVYAYDISSTKLLWFRETYVPFSLTYHPDNQAIAVPSLGLSLLDVSTGQIIKEISYQDGCFGSQEIAYSPDGTKIITLGTSPDYGTTTIYVWNAESDQCLEVLAEEQGVAFDFDISQDGKFLVLGLRDIKIEQHYEQQVHVWDVATRKQVCSFEGAQPIAFTLDGALIAVTDPDNKGQVDLWDAKSCQFLDALHREEQATPYSMDFSPDGKLLAIGRGQIFQIWDVADRKLLFASDKLPNRVNILDFSPDGRFLLFETDRTSIDDKATITLWGISQ